MKNEQIAEVFEMTAQILEIKGENVFKVRAYYNAARLIRGLSEPAAELVARGEPLPGIGEALREKILELAKTGRLAHFEKLKRTVPPGLPDLLRVPGMGPKGVLALWKLLGVTDLKKLEKACRDGRVAKLKGFGERKQAKILAGLGFLAGHSGRYRLGDALPAARALLAWLKDSGLAGEVSLAGSIRRGKPLIQDIDILASSRRPEKLMERLVQAEGVVETLARGPTKTSVRLASGLQVDLRVVADGEFPYALLYFTGSKEHNVLMRQRAQRMGLKLNEYGLFKGERLLPARTEADCFRHLGLAYIEPELREASGEIEAAERGDLPRLIEAEDLKGVFHNHSDWSDGRASIEDMAERARAMGFEYLGLSDHSRAAHYANGMDEARLRSQMREVAALNKRWKDFRILQGLECDILPDGRLDLSPAVLRELDFVIGSVHSRFEMKEGEMTARVCRALADENLDILGHPTGRLLLEREAYPIDLERVIDAAKAHGKVLEINANPWRLDLDAPFARRAAQGGVLLSINPDAHSPKGLEDVEFGVAVARRAWVTREQVLNARPWRQALAALG